MVLVESREPQCRLFKQLRKVQTCAEPTRSPAGEPSKTSNKKEKWTEAVENGERPSKLRQPKSPFRKLPGRRVRGEEKTNKHGNRQGKSRSALSDGYDHEEFTLKELLGVVLCSAEALEPKFDFPVRKSLKPLFNLQKGNEEFVVNPMNFRGAGG